MNLLIAEYFSGGGYANRKLSGSVLSEAYGMVRSVISDFKTAGHDVTMLMDSRLKRFNPPNDALHTVWVSAPDEFWMKLKEHSGVADAVYVIAPESGQMLEKLVETVEVSGGTSLNCGVDAIKHVSNKMTFYEIMKKTGLKVPETVLLDVNEKNSDVRRLVEELGYPLVFKPLDGVSCSGLSVVRDGTGVDGAIRKVAQESTRKQFVAQKLIDGKAASACVFSSGKEAVAVTLNRQFVTLAPPDEESKYYGGVVPFNHVLGNEALMVAQRAVEAVKGLKGYVGVDLVLTDETAFVMEVNPRLTASYIGLRHVVDFNPAEAIVDAVIKRKMPKDVQTSGYVFFSKVETPSSPKLLADTYKIKGVVSPPFPIEENKPAYALLAAASISLRGAQSAFYRSKKRLLSFYS